MPAPTNSLTSKLAALPHLGVGISAEPGSHRNRAGTAAMELRAAHPDLCHFLEYGGDLARGLDEHALAWAGAGLPATYHFLDLNLEERADLDAGWLARTDELVKKLRAPWVCGDAGRWHIGPRDRGQEILLPPILTLDSARETAECVAAVEDALGLPCLPENPPSHIYLGPLHILDYFAEVSRRASCGLLLDCAHLAIFQRLRGHAPLDALDGFPLDRVVELHVAGGRPFSAEGLALVEDDHGTELLPETFQILDHVLPRAPNLRALVYECEKNPPAEVLPVFVELNRRFPTPARRDELPHLPVLPCP